MRKLGHKQQQKYEQIIQKSSLVKQNLKKFALSYI